MTTGTTLGGVDRFVLATLNGRIKSKQEASGLKIHASQALKALSKNDEKEATLIKIELKET